MIATGLVGAYVRQLEGGEQDLCGTSREGCTSGITKTGNITVTQNISTMAANQLVNKR